MRAPAAAETPWARDLLVVPLVAIGTALIGSAALWIYGQALGIWVVGALISRLGDTPAAVPWWSTDTGIAVVSGVVFTLQVVATVGVLYVVTRRRPAIAAGFALAVGLVALQVRVYEGMEAQAEAEGQERARIDAERAAEAEAARQAADAAQRARDAAPNRPGATPEEQHLLDTLRAADGAAAPTPAPTPTPAPNAAPEGPAR